MRIKLIMLAMAAVLVTTAAVPIGQHQHEEHGASTVALHEEKYEPPIPEAAPVRHPVVDRDDQIRSYEVRTAYAAWLVGIAARPARPARRAQAVQTIARPSNTSVKPASGSCQAIVVAAFPETASRALAIAGRESGCGRSMYNPSHCSKNGDHAIGVFQLCLPMHADMFEGACKGKWYDVYCGVKAARKLYDAEGGWLPAW